MFAHLLNKQEINQSISATKQKFCDHRRDITSWKITEGCCCDSCRSRKRETASKHRRYFFRMSLSEFTLLSLNCCAFLNIQWDGRYPKICIIWQLLEGQHFHILPYSGGPGGPGSPGGPWFPGAPSIPGWPIRTPRGSPRSPLGPGNPVGPCGPGTDARPM